MTLLHDEGASRKITNALGALNMKDAVDEGRPFISHSISATITIQGVTTTQKTNHLSPCDDLLYPTFWTLIETGNHTIIFNQRHSHLGNCFVEMLLMQKLDGRILARMGLRRRIYSPYFSH